MTMTTPGIPLSPSLERASQRFHRTERIRSWALVQNLLTAHPEYGRNLARKLSSEVGPRDGEQRTVDEWLANLQQMFDPQQMRQLNGRVGILGLARLDPTLHQYLESWEFIAALEEELREPFESLLRERAGEGARAPRIRQEEPEPGRRDTRSASISGDARATIAAGYVSDHVHADAPDQLDITDEVQTIAHVLASKRVMPPLSLGLFGDWGTGKSFFMTKLQAYIRALAQHYRQEEKETGVPSEWCTRVLHIEFNTWHYSDANLWASLVTRIYEALQEELQPGTSDDELKQRLQMEVQNAQGVTHEAQVQFSEAETRVKNTNAALHESRARMQAQEGQVEQLIGDVRTLLSDNPQVRDDLENAADALGVPAAAESYRALQELHDNIVSLSGRLSAIGMAALRAPGALLLLALLAIALPAGVSWLLTQPWLNLSAMGRRVIEVSTLLVGVVAWLQRQVGRGVNLVQTIDEGLNTARAARERRIENNKEVREALQQLALAASEQEAARQNLERAQAELQRLQIELKELSPERKLFRLLEERGRSATYTQHLGIISLIRRDFDKISGELAKMEQEPRDLTCDPPPIQRIILYIDDLDRCRPERVVQVLEAVHMLLAFPLFTVVLGVDPRWLRHSLAQQYPAILGSDGADAGESSAFYSTPQDYMEKIFQIPFALRRVEKTGYRNLVADLLKPPLLASKGDTEDRSQGEIARDRLDETGVSWQPGPEGKGETHGVEERGGDASRPEQREHRSFTPIAARQLEFTSWEKQDIDRLWRLFTSPRTVKRFINTYRLLRASVRAEDVHAFEGSESDPGEYQIALLLLAIVSSSPNEMALFQSHLLHWSAQPEASERNQAPWYWSEVLEEIRQPLSALDPDWADIDAALQPAVDESFMRGFSKDVLVHWSLRVARYSFSVVPPRAPQRGHQESSRYPSRPVVVGG